MDRITITKQGFERMRQELERLTTHDRKEVIQAIAEAREHGDLSENAEYHAARERQSFLEGRIAELESNISKADVVDPAQFAGSSTIKFGAIVEIVDSSNQEKQTYQLVNEHEASIEDGRLSTSSPLAKAMIGKAVNDFFEVNTPLGKREYQVVKLDFK